MRPILHGLPMFLALWCGSPAAASLTPEEFAKADIAGFRLGMSMTEAEAVIRARTNIEEPSADLMQAYDCNDLLPQDSEFAYEDLAPDRLPVSTISTHAIIICSMSGWTMVPLARTSAGSCTGTSSRMASGTPTWPTP